MNFKLSIFVACILFAISTGWRVGAQDATTSRTRAVDNFRVASRSQSQLPTPEEIKGQFTNVGVTQPLAPIRPTDSSVSDTAPQLREPVITLRGAVEEAAVSNQSVSRDRFEVSRFKWDYFAAQASRLPNVRAISYLAQQTVPGNALIPNRADAFVFVAALMPITQQYRLGLDAKVLKIGREIAQIKLDQELDDTRAKVKAAYYKLVLDQSKVDTLGISIKYLKELEVTTANRVKEGNSLKVEALKVEAKLEKTQLDLTKASNALQIDREKFNHLLGRNIEGTVVLEAIPPPDAVELNVHEAEERALRQRPEVRAADARRRQIHVEKKIRIAEYIPNVSVGAVYITLPGYNNTVVPKNTFAPGMFMTYNAFDWGRRAFLAKAQTKSEHAALINLANVKDEVLIDLHSQVNKVSEARLAIKTTKFARDVALEDLRVSMNRYKFTSDKLAEVLAAQSTLADANNNYEQALLSFWEAKAEFDRAVGE